MCGIHGVLNKSTATNKTPLAKFIEEGFIVNSVRGMDSSGIVQISHKNDPYMHKQALPGPQYIDTKAAKAFFADVANSPLTLCHVRAATAGRVTADNAHPFLVPAQNDKRIIGVHNGTLNSWRGKEEAAKYDVDSEWGLSRIGKYGKNAFEMIDGAFVFAWWDENHPGKMFVARNKDRPFWFLFNKDKSAMLFASEPGMITWLAERHSMEVEDTVYSAEEMKLYTFDYSGKEITWTKEEIPAYKYSAGSTATTNGNDWRSRRQNHGYNSCGVGDDWDYGTGRGGTTVAPSSFPYAGERLVNESSRILREARTERFKGLVDDEGSDGDDEGGAAKDTGRPLSRKERKREKRRQKLLSLPSPGRKPTNIPKAADLAAALARAGVSGSAGIADVNTILKEGADRAGVEHEICHDEILPEAWYTSGGATPNEKQAAKTLGVMGSLEWFQGVYYETETGELHGDVEIYIPGEGKKKTIGIVRNMSATAAAKEFDNGGWVAVIGLAHRKDLGGKVYVMAPLTDEGKSGMKKRAA